MKICLVIGYPIKTSRSPSQHNAAYKKLGIDDKFTYLRVEVKPKDLKMAVDGIKGLGIRGVSVTMPHKQTVMKYLDKIDKDAKAIGAINTIVNNSGKLTGFNTDYLGAMTALGKKINPKGKTVAVIGAGGAARAIIFGLSKSGAKVKIFNRSVDKAKSLAKEFGCKWGSLKALEDIAGVDVVINCTPVGMNENISPISKKFLNKNQIVFDIVYLPKETRLIKEAKEKGAKIIYGYEMLLYQGVAQFELYTGLKAPVEVMRKTLEDSL